MSNEIELVELDDQPTAVVRAHVPMEHLRQVFDRGFHTVMAALATQGLAPSGPPFGLYHQVSNELVDVEVGFPVPRPFSDGDVGASRLPAGRAVQAMHVGPYETLGATYERIQSWMQQEGLQPGAVMWECYLTDPSAEPDPATWRTLVYWPVD